MRVTGLLWLLLMLFVACTNNTALKTDYFDTKAYFNNELIKLKGQKLLLIKDLKFNNNSETLVIDTPNWENELAPFIEVDLLKPAYAGRFMVSKENNTVNYISTDKHTDIKSVKIIFNANGNADSITIVMQKNNNLYQSDKQLQYVLNKGFTITGVQKVTLMRQSDYALKATFKRIDKTN